MVFISKLVILLVIALAAIGTAMSQDMIKYNDPIAKDLSNLTSQEISAIFFGDGSWFGDGGAAIGTAIQRGVLDIGDGGKPMGNVTKKEPLRCGKGLA